MKKNIILISILVCAMAAGQFCAYAKDKNSMPLPKLLGKLTKSGNTSLMRLDIVDEYKGEIVAGAGSVKDIIKSFGNKDEAMVYLRKSYKGKEYELVLLTDAIGVEKIRKGKSVSFSGNFVGITYLTLRFENVEITTPKSWWWPF